jgi:RNA polymerase sigma-70 factor (ECF subfamily)
VPETTALLHRWHAGDEAALHELLEQHLPWIRIHVRQRLGPALRAKEETSDLVQDALIEFLRYGPRFEVANEAHLRFLLGRVAENVLRDRHDYFTRLRRKAAREEPLGDDSVLVLDGSAREATQPDAALEKKQWQAWVRLALELMEPEERAILVMREWEELEFAEIGSRLSIAPDAARMRFQRALPRLADKIRQLQRGSIDAIEIDQG